MGLSRLMTDSLYILLVFDGRYVFVPQNEVQSIEIIADVQVTQDSNEENIGWFLEHGLESPVFCLSYDLSLLTELPQQREYLIILKDEQLPVGITGDEVENINIERENLHLQDLPIVMRTAESPLNQLLIYKDKIGCVCSGPSLVKYLKYLTGHDRLT